MMNKMSRPAEFKPYALKENFVPPEMCEYLRLFFERSITDLGRPNDVKSFAYRTIRFANIDEKHSEQYRNAKQFLNIVRLKAANFLKNEFGIDEIYPEYTEIVKWPESYSQDPHRDLSRKTTTYAAILYLNDDFDGGQTYFPEHGIEVAPKTGRLVGFFGSQIVHGVRKVVNGTRFTTPCWFTAQAEYAEL